MYRGKSTLPQGQATCLPCRQAEPGNGGYRRVTKRHLHCPECGADFTSSQPAARFCSRNCKEIDARRRKGMASCPLPPVPVACSVCGAESPGGYPAKRSRCDGCRPVMHGPPSPARCHICAEWFPKTSSTSKYCSDPCRNQPISDRLMGFYRTAMRELDIPKASMWRHKLCQYLSNRDGGRCHLCGKKVDLKLPSGPRGDDLGPSIDHLVPRSKGGSDELSNLSLTHWACNRNKRANAMGEQLRLVG